MTLVPLPGSTEAELVAKVGNSVIKGLRAASQPSPWPDIREALLELHAILHEWVRRSAATTRDAEVLIHARRLNARQSAPPAWTVSFGEGSANLMPANNLGQSYVRENARDTRDILQGKVQPQQRLRGSTRRRASRRGLRTILAAYCPELLEQFEAATTARQNWVTEHREDFDRWFADRTDAQVAELISSMKATHAALAETEQQLGEFIRVSFPLPGN